MSKDERQVVEFKALENKEKTNMADGPTEIRDEGEIYSFDESLYIPLFD